jgi:hypothetical protein
MSVVTLGFPGRAADAMQPTSRVGIAIWLGHTSPIYFLNAVVLVLFSRCLLGEFIHYRIALRLSCFNILLLGFGALSELELRDPRTSSFRRFAG